MDSSGINLSNWGEWIKVRKNASFKGGGCMSRKFAVVEQLDSSDWRKEEGYGYLGCFFEMTSIRAPLA